MTIKGVDCPIKSGNDGKRKPGNDEKGKLQPADGRRLRVRHNGATRR